MRKTLQQILNSGNSEEIRQWLAGADLEEINGFIAGSAFSNSDHQRALGIRDRLHFERLSKPHWTLVPTFWICTVGTAAGVAGVIVAVIALRSPVAAPAPQPAAATVLSVQTPPPSPAGSPPSPGVAPSSTARTSTPAPSLAVPLSSVTPSPKPTAGSTPVAP